MFRYIISLLLTMALLILGTWLGSTIDWWPLPLLWLQIIFFVFFITLTIGYKLIQLRQKQAQIFIQFYLVSILLKMVAGLSFVLFIIWKMPSEIRGHAALFILAYLLFTFTEVLFLVRTSR